MTQEVDFCLNLDRVHGLDEELGRHRGREGKTECSLCGNECENVSHMLWECSAYSSSRASFICTGSLLVRQYQRNINNS